MWLFLLFLITIFDGSAEAKPDKSTRTESEDFHNRGEFEGSDRMKATMSANIILK